MPMVEEIDAPPGASAKAVSYNMNTGTFESKDCGRTEEVIAHEFEEMMSAVHQYKETGNRHFGDGYHTKALDCYQKARILLESDGMVDVDFGNSDERRDQLADNRVTILLNLANCFLRQVDDRAKTVGLDDRTAKLQGAVDLCTKILSISPTSPKALYRRGLAREKLEQLEDAADDLRACRKLSPKDKQVKSALARVIEGSKRQRRVREAGFRGSIPAQPTTTASRHRCNRQIDRIWSLTGVATGTLPWC
jgi:tetratricopeptide (TPR) repeat protein